MKIIKPEDTQIKFPRVLIYGKHGIGKTTFATSRFEKPCAIRTEKTDVGCDTLPVCNTWEDFGAQLKFFGEKCKAGEYKTLVIDTLTQLDILLSRYVCTRNKVKALKDMDFGSGYIECEDRMKNVCTYLDELNSMGVVIVFLAHSVVKTVSEPDVDDYERYDLSTSKKVGLFISNWADCVYFMHYDQQSVKIDGKSRVISEGKRMFLTSDKPSARAKNRIKTVDGETTTGDVSYDEAFEMLARFQDVKFDAPHPKEQAQKSTVGLDVVKEGTDPVNDDEDGVEKSQDEGF